MREATQFPLKHDPVKSVELLADKFQLTENERGDILRQLFMEADNCYERATELERIGGEILSLPISHNLLPPTVNAYKSLPEYETIPA